MKPAALSEAAAEQPKGLARELALPRDRENPSLFDALAADPTLPLDACARRDMVHDLRRGSRRYLFPTIRVLTRLLVLMLIFIKRALPFNVSSLKLLSVGSVWFGRHFVSPEAQRLLMRHFVIETQLLNFIARNAGAGAACPLPEYDLVPTRVSDLGDWRGRNAVALHDANVMNLMIDLGHTPGVDVKTRRPLSELDFSMLDMPTLQVDEARIIFALDFPSALYISVFYIALLFDDRTIERAVNSFQLDESLLTVLANLTGDDLFRTWTPVRFPTWLGSPTGDPARDLHWHIIVHEYAYHHLLALRARAAQAEQPA